MSLRNSDAVVPTWPCHLKQRSEPTLGQSWISCACERDKMLNVRDTIIAVKRRCLHLAAALAIDKEQQKRLDDAEEEEQEKVIPPQWMTQRKVWVREWLIRKPEFGQYDNLLTKLHKKDQRATKITSKSHLSCSKRCHGRLCTATICHGPCHDEFTMSSRTVGA